MQKKETEMQDTILEEFYSSSFPDIHAPEKLKAETLQAMLQKNDEEKRFYKENLSEIRAPEKLKAETLQAMLQKNEEIRKEKEKNSNGGEIIDFRKFFSSRRIQTAAAVFAVIIIASAVLAGRGTGPEEQGGIDFPGIYNITEKVDIKTTGTEKDTEDIPDAIASLHLDKVEHNKIFDRSGTELNDVSLIQYSREDRTLRIFRSSNLTMVPETGNTAGTETISGYEVTYGTDAQGKNSFALWNDGEYLYYAVLENDAGEEIRDIVRDFMESQNRE